MFSKAVQHIWEQESVLHICEQAALSGFTQCNNGVWIKKFQCLFLQCTAFWITKHLLLRIHTWECYSYAKSQVPLNMLQSVAVCCSVLQCVEYTCICVCIECHGSQCAVALDKNTLFTRVCLRVRMHIQVYMFICVCLYIIQSVRRIVVWGKIMGSICVCVCVHVCECMCVWAYLCACPCACMCVYVYICKSIYVYTHIHTYSFTCTCMCACVYVCKYTCVYIQIFTCTLCVCIRVNMYTHMHAHMYTYIHAHAHMNFNRYTYIHAQTYKCQQMYIYTRTYTYE